MDDTWEDHFRTYDAIITRLVWLQNNSPGLSVKADVTAGDSLRGNWIWYLRVSGNDSDKRPCGKPKPIVIFTGGLHAREWIAPEMVLRAAEHLILNYDEDDRNKKLRNDLKYLVDNCELYFIPVCNPDAVIYTQSAWNKLVMLEFGEGAGAWKMARDGRLRRKNLRDRSDMGTSYSFAAAKTTVTIGGETYYNAELGVDLNRNWDPGWGNTDAKIAAPSNDRRSQSYMGGAKFSEPETQALKSFISGITGLSRIRAVVDYHSHMVSIIYPETSRPPSKRDKDVEKAIEGSKGIRVAHKPPGGTPRYTTIKIPFEKLVDGQCCTF